MSLATHQLAAAVTLPFVSSAVKGMTVGQSPMRTTPFNELRNHNVQVTEEFTLASGSARHERDIWTGLKKSFSRLRHLIKVEIADV